MNKFPLHGSVDLDVIDNILMVEGYGPWNLESVIESGERVVPLIKQLSLAGPWGALVVLHGDPIYVPDAANFLAESIQQQRKQGRVATSLVVEESNSPEFAKRHLSSIFDQAGETFRFFPNKEQAKWWLVQKIIRAEQTDN